MPSLISTSLSSSSGMTVAGMFISPGEGGGNITSGCDTCNSLSASIGGDGNGDGLAVRS